MLLYSGSGKVTVSGDAVATAEAPGRMELQITPNSGECGALLPSKRQAQLYDHCGEEGHTLKSPAMHDTLYPVPAI